MLPSRLLSLRPPTILRHTRTQASFRSLTSISRTPISNSPSTRSEFDSFRHPPTTHRPQIRTYASPAGAPSGVSPADEIMEEITELYATAKDEFEIATEETEKHSIYAADDRAAARDELAKVKAAYEKALEGEHGEEIKRRVGQRIRELDNAITELNKADLED